jgi:NADPH2:quinone reductase
MQAAFYRAKGAAAEVLQIGEVPTPAPARGEVRVRLGFSGVNPSDVKARAGVSGAVMPFPLVIPHSDGAGVIDAVGDDVAKEWRGRRVWIYNGQWERAHGTAAEYIVVPVSQAVALPEHVSLEHGASVGIPLMTAYHALAACGDVRQRSVLVPGAAGAVGQYAVQLAKRKGAHVIAVVSSEAKGQHAREAGADAVVNYRLEDLVARVRALTDGRGADFLIDVDAAAHAARYGELLAFGGKAVIYGSSQATIGMPFRPLIMGFVSVYFFIVYRLSCAALDETIRGVTELLQQSALRHSDTRVFSLGEVAKAHELVERGAAAKVLVRV